MRPCSKRDIRSKWSCATHKLWAAATPFCRGYDASCRTLEILFQSGAIYLYYFVPQEVHRGLMGAASHGTYFNKAIKRVYEFHRIAEPRDIPKPRKRAVVAKPKKLPAVVPALIETTPAKPPVEKPPARTERTSRKPRKRRERTPAPDTGRASTSPGSSP